MRSGASTDGQVFRSTAEHAEHAEFFGGQVMRGREIGTASGVVRTKNKKALRFRYLLGVLGVLGG